MLLLNYDHSKHSEDKNMNPFFGNKPTSPTSSEPTQQSRLYESYSHDKRQSLMMPTPSRVSRHHPYQSPTKGYMSTFKYDMTGYK